MSTANDPPPYPNRPRRRTISAASVAVAACLLAIGACAPAAGPGARPGGPGASPPSGTVAASAIAAPEPELPVGWAQQGEASWYGPNFAGRPTANGETFDPSRLTAAHPSLPFDTRVTVTNLDNGRSVVVRINDRGPFAHGRVIDLSRAAAEAIGLVATGVADVRIEPAGGPDGVRTLRVDARLTGYDVILPGAAPGSLLVLRSAAGAEVLARAVDVEPEPEPGLDGFELWTSAALAERLGAVATVTIE